MSERRLVSLDDWHGDDPAFIERWAKAVREGVKLRVIAKFIGDEHPWSTHDTEEHRAKIRAAMEAHDGKDNA